MSLSAEEQLAAAMQIPLPPCSLPSSPPPPPPPPSRYLPPPPSGTGLESWNPSPWGSPPRFPDWYRQAASPASPLTPLLPPAPAAPTLIRPSRLDAACRHSSNSSHKQNSPNAFDPQR
eukprot:scpid111245/ scgid10148/ 